MKKYLFIILIIIGLFSISSAYAQDFQGIDEDFNYSRVNNIAIKEAKGITEI